MAHPVALESLERFLRGTASREENQRVVLHLLRGCALCARQVEQALDPPGAKENDGYDAAFERFERMTWQAGRDAWVSTSLPSF